jgi:hypothetical protein
MHLLDKEFVYFFRGGDDQGDLKEGVKAYITSPTTIIYDLRTNDLIHSENVQR